ncbi:MAG: GNAT family N-acetyltransferase [Flavobacteriales bacterium]|nr:GNAT family N-acetyltransferase [Flavobacteriales bacterium]
MSTHWYMISIREAQKKDAKHIHRLITELAVYEKLEHEVKATIKDLEISIFDKKQAKVLIAELDNEIVAYALYFESYSTFLAKAGIYLEDLYVERSHRGKGIGKTLLARLAKITIENNYGRLEWAVLDWNSPAIDFYKSIGANPMEGWTVNRLTGKALNELSKK